MELTRLLPDGPEQQLNAHDVALHGQLERVEHGLVGVCVVVLVLQHRLSHVVQVLDEVLHVLRERRRQI